MVFQGYHLFTSFLYFFSQGVSSRTKSIANKEQTDKAKCIGGSIAIAPTHHKPTADAKKVTGWNNTMQTNIFGQFLWSFGGRLCNFAPMKSMRNGDNTTIHRETTAPITYKMHNVICQSSPRLISLTIVFKQMSFEEKSTSLCFLFPLKISAYILERKCSNFNHCKIPAPSFTKISSNSFKV